MAEKHNILTVIKSVFSAFIGVQSNKNRENDFQEGKAIHFIIAGVLGVIIFITLLITLVATVLPS
jgi:hypothetical protein